MARRFVYFQGSPAAPAYPLKLLLKGSAAGYYVGGWNTEPVFVATDPGIRTNRLRLLGITATGPGPNDWLVGGWKRVGDTFSVVFYDHTGLIFEDVGNYVFAGVGGQFSSGATFGIEAQNYFWAKPTGEVGATTVSDDGYSNYGFVLPGTLSGRRLSTNANINASRDVIVQNQTLTYAIFIGNSPAGTVNYPNGNPWLATAAGGFTRLNTDLNDAIPRGDLIGLTLYVKAVGIGYSFNTPWTAAGQQSVNVTPWQITTGGTATAGTPFPVAYQAPDPGQYFALDSSLWVQPSTAP